MQGIVRLNVPVLLPIFKEKYGSSEAFTDNNTAASQCYNGLFSKELEEAAPRDMMEMQI